MAEPTRIRRLLPRDLDAVLAIQAASPEAASWSRADYEDFCLGTSKPRGDCGERGWVAAPSTVRYGAAREELIVGFLVARRAADELEVLNLAVASAHRRAGIASLLLEHALADARGSRSPESGVPESGARRAYLEVRASNHAAIAFYQRHGFTVSGRRARYYADPIEDALVLSRALVP